MKLMFDKRYLVLTKGVKYDTIRLDTDYICKNDYHDDLFEKVRVDENYINDSFLMLNKLGIIKNCIGGLGRFGRFRIKKEYSLDMFKEIDRLYKGYYRAMVEEDKKNQNKEVYYERF